jgi:hypothetical protein
MDTHKNARLTPGGRRPIGDGGARFPKERVAPNLVAERLSDS